MFLFFKFCRLKILGSRVILETWVSILHMCSAISEKWLKVLNQQTALRKQHQFKLVKVVCVVSLILGYMIYLTVLL